MNGSNLYNSVNAVRSKGEASDARTGLDLTMFIDDLLLLQVKQIKRV